MKKKIMIIGADGVLGNYACNLLNNNSGYDVIAVTRNGFNSINCDLLDESSIVNAIKISMPDYLINFAATFSNDFDLSLNINVIGVRHLLDAIEEYVPNCRTLLIGSAAEYGLVSPNENPVSEHQVLRPVSPYGLTKAWQTQLMIYYANKSLNVSVARLFNYFGVKMSERLFIGRIQKQIDEVINSNRKFIQVGHLTAVRDYIHIDDALENIFKVLFLGKSGEVYNIGSGIGITMRDVLNRELSNNNLSHIIVQEDKDFSNRVGYDVPVIVADITKVSQLN